MPVRNGGVYLIDAVDSILRQQQVYFQLNIINDHSDDKAIEKLPQDNRIRVLNLTEHSTGSGIVAALNLGIEKSYLPFIARMDSDDIAHPQRLITQLRLLISNPKIDVCGTKVEMFNEQGIIDQGYSIYQEWINNLTEPEEIEREFFIESPIPHPSAMLSRRLMQELDCYADSKWPEDYDLWCRALIKGKRFAKPSGNTLLKWRDHSGRLSRTDKRYNKKMFLECKAFYLHQYLSQKCIQRCQIWGTGPTGLKLHDLLEAQGMPITNFIDVNPKMQTRKKRDKGIHIVSQKPTTKQISLLKPKQGELILIAVAARGARARIRNYLRAAGLAESAEYIFAA